MHHNAVRALGLFLLVALAGCGENQGSVKGTVTFDGRPVVNGAVTFVKSDGGLVREGAVIRDGSFQTRMPPGKYKIEVNAQKVVGKKKQKGFDGTEEEIELTEEMFPERYNTKTELSEEIKAGANTVNLDLKSKK
jgi:hypothetical protein